MKKVSALLSILMGLFGFNSIAQNIDSESNEIVRDLTESELTFEEIEYLEYLATSNPDILREFIEQDFRVKGAKNFEIFATANKGGGPCINGVN